MPADQPADDLVRDLPPEPAADRAEGQDKCYGCGPDNPDGLRLAVHQEGGATWAEFDPRRGHEGPPGHLHGGVAAGALDETMAWAAFANGNEDGEDEAWVTATMRVRFRAPVPLDGGPYRVETDVAKASGRRKRVVGRILLADGTAAVEGEAVFVKVG